MIELTVQIPDNLKAFVDAEVAAGTSASASGLVCALLREAQKRKVREKVDALLAEGLKSGEPMTVTPEYWEAKRQHMEERLGTEGQS